MITAWDVYLVMQLDSMNEAAMFVATVSLISAAICMIVSAVSFKEPGEEPQPADVGANSYLLNYLGSRHEAWADRASSRVLSDKAAKLAKRLGCTFILAAATVTVLPSTKTAAAMIVLPALTSEEVTKPLAKEAGDLYRLAKRALEDAVDAEPVPEPTQ